jgi:hypothetical protein
MDTIKLWLFYLRDFIARNFMVLPMALIYNNQLIYFNSYKYIIYLIFRLLPFGLIRILLELFNIGIIYKLDSIYNITNIRNNHIIPIILNFYFIYEHNNCEIKKDFLSNIKYYNGGIPLNFITNENNLQKYRKIKIKYLNKGKILDKLLDINDFSELPIYKLFEN